MGIWVVLPQGTDTQKQEKLGHIYSINMNQNIQISMKEQLEFQCFTM